VIAAAALLCGLVPARALAQTHTGPACTESGIRWTDPVTRAGLRYGWPELELRQGAAYAFGKEPARTGGAGALVALHKGVEELGLPAGAIKFYDPVFTVDRTGTLHVLWGEHEEGHVPDPVLPSGRPSVMDQFHLGRVLYARYRNGRWSRAYVVHRGPSVSWHRSLLTRLVEDANGNLHVVFTIGGPHALVHLRRDAGGWRTTTWMSEPAPPRNPSLTGMIPAGGGLYARLVATQSGRLYLAYATAARPASGERIPGGDVNSLWVRRSDDAGLTWGAAVLVHLGGTQGAYDPQIVATGRDTVHVVWHRRLDARTGREVILHALSADGGVTWGSPVEVRPPTALTLRHLRAVATSKGEVYAAFMSVADSLGAPGSTRGLQQMFYARWDGSRWSAPRLLRPEMSALYFDLRIDDADRLHLLWPYLVPPASGEGERRRLLSYAVGSPCEP
jgi:hypothetical protein